MNLREVVLDFLFPPHCPVCGAYVENRGGWCEGCLQHTLQTVRLPLSAEFTGVIEEAWSMGRYQGGLRELIRALKYHGKRDRLPFLKTFLEQAEPRLQSLFGHPLLVVPVPLHPTKEKERGFNQAELIFREWLAARGIPMKRCLQRVRATVPQYGLGAKERRQNLKGAFALLPGITVEGRDILLVDDIFTTGATMMECARVLRENGAKRILALTLASDHGGPSGNRKT